MRSLLRTLRWFCTLLLVSGICLSGRALYLHLKADLAGMLIRRAWDQSVRTGELRPPWPWADTHPVARLRIARLKYDEIVLEGATPRTLAFGPARLFSGAGLGEPGNLVLAGHRTSWFRPLKSLAQGDIIEIDWFGPRVARSHTRRYTVDAISVVSPQDLALLAPTSDDALTLITCYPFGYGATSPQRFIVRATPSEPSGKDSPFRRGGE